LSNNVRMLELVASLGFEIRNDPTDYAVNQVEVRLHS